MDSLDKKLINDMKEDIENSVFNDEYGYFIDSLADLEADKDIFDKCLGGDKNEC